MPTVCIAVAAGLGEGVRTWAKLLAHRHKRSIKIEFFFIFLDFGLGNLTILARNYVKTMKRQPLLELLRHYSPTNPAECQMWQDSINFVETQPDCFERWFTLGHITGSAWIIDPTRQHALLMHHRKLNRWFQPGGHADGVTNVQEVALKEAAEETGLADIQPIGSSIFDIDVHLIAARNEMPAHLHYDIRFLFEANPTVPLLGNHESNALRWIQLQEIENYNNSDSILRMVNKTLKMKRLE